MNKYQEALDKLLMWSSNGYCALEVESEEYTYLKGTLQELVDRATPVAIELRNDAFHCPRCGASIHNKLIYTFYCNECGQAFEGGMKDVK